MATCLRRNAYLRRIRGVCRVKLVDPVRREPSFKVSKAVEPELPETLRPVGGAGERGEESFRAPGMVVALEYDG